MADELKNLRIFVCTWNVAQKEPLSDKEFSSLLQLEGDGDVDLYAIGFQEIKTGARETVNSFIFYDDWANALADFLVRHDYYLVENTRVQGISLCVFALKKHLPYIRFVMTEIERTGIAGAWGNKGGVAVSCWLYGQRVCFLNVHLSAHLENYEERIKDVEEIFREMEFGGKATVTSHDLVLMFGDTNFRLDDCTRAFVIETVAKKNYSVLWEKDQLIRRKGGHSILSSFEEGILDFDPTYKYDPGTDIYDTSEKQRKPAWTDRILWRIHPEVKKSAPSFSLNLVKDSFMGLKSFKRSDHKPVVCEFDMKILNAGLHEPLLRLETEGDWYRGRDGNFSVEPREGMEWSSKDYVALYKEPFRDFRSYRSYMYVRNYNKDGSSSSSSSDDDESQARCGRYTGSDPTQCKRYLTYKKSRITEAGTCRLGYFSHNASCLVAMSDPFLIR